MQSFRVKLLSLAAIGLCMNAGFAMADFWPRQKIALSNNYAGNSWRQAMLKSWEKVTGQAVKDGVVAEASAPPHRKIEVTEQAAQIQNLILQGYQAIVINAASPDALNGAVKQACDAGIIVVSFDGIVTEKPCAWRVAARRSRTRARGARGRDPPCRPVRSRTSNRPRPGRRRRPASGGRSPRARCRSRRAAWPPEPALLLELLGVQPGSRTRSRAPSSCPGRCGPACCTPLRGDRARPGCRCSRPGCAPSPDRRSADHRPSLHSSSASPGASSCGVSRISTVEAFGRAERRSQLPRGGVGSRSGRHRAGSVRRL